ncbi:MgpC family cytadherence protein [Mycoplasmoides genitalium]|uniref:MgpC family cytadherence protein n=1 Tax=Mycoplasmoides genitalium TaxID=2097 RepID=UPI001ED92F48|nr:MgpC family cytadherence protein [Mycoplasmoides genitalium]
MGEGNSNAQDTFSFVVPYSGNHTNSSGSSGTIKTAYPVKKDEASQVAINSLINATPLNSYGTIKKLPVNKKQVVNYLSN